MLKKHNVKHCGCSSNSQGSTNGAKFQDKEYGKGNRLHNLMKDGGFRCTVCGSVKATTHHN